MNPTHPRLLAAIRGAYGDLFGIDNSKLIVHLVNNAAILSSALRRAMAVVNGLREMHVGPDCAHGDCQHECGPRNGLFRMKRDRLLSENGFGE